MATFPREEFSIHLVRQEQAPNCGSGFRRPLNPCSTSPALEVLWKGVGPESPGNTPVPCLPPAGGSWNFPQDHSKAFYLIALNCPAADLTVCHNKMVLDLGPFVPGKTDILDA